MKKRIQTPVVVFVGLGLCACISGPHDAEIARLDARFRNGQLSTLDYEIQRRTLENQQSEQYLNLNEVTTTGDFSFPDHSDPGAEKSEKGKGHHPSADGKPQPYCPLPPVPPR